MPQAYGIGGYVNVPPGPVSGVGAPPTSFVGQLGQQYFDTSTSPPTEYIYNGVTWQSGGNAYATTSAAGIVQLSSNVTTDQASTTLVPYAKAVFDYGQSLVLAGASIAQTMKDKELNKDFYTVKEFAKKLDLHTNTVYKCIKTGRINAFRIGGGFKSSYRIPATEIHIMALKDMTARLGEK